MKTFFRLFLALIGVFSSPAASPFASQQCPPDIEWQQEPADLITRVVPMADGGYFLAVAGDETFGFYRTDAKGNFLWSRPNPYSHPGAIAETDNGDVVVATYYAIIRLDRTGQIVWTRDVTNALFFPSAIQQTPGGGFLIVGEIIPDIAFIQMDGDGNILSQRTIATFESYPKLLKIRPVKSGGDIVGCYVSFDGDYDLRLTRVDEIGNILWEHTYGGIGFDFLASIEGTSDGGFIVGASSYSSAGKQKESPFFGDGLFQPGDYLLAGGDFWVVRLDANGNKIWDRSFGGNLGDLFATAKEMPDHGFIIVGSSYSPAGTGNKTSPAFGDTDGWVVRTGAAGNKLWEQSFGTPGEDLIIDVQIRADGSLILGGTSLIKLQPEEFSDCDHDGVPDSVDECSDTAAGDPVNSHGCSIDQLLPCESNWKSRGEYLKKYRDLAEEFLRQGY